MTGRGPGSRGSAVLGVLAVVVLVVVGFAASARPATPQPPDGPLVVRAGSGQLVPGLPAGVLYARSATSLYALRTDDGRLTRTDEVRLQTAGPVAFVPTTHGIVLRPRDLVPGFVVPDGGVPADLTDGLAGVRMASPGPGGRLWVQAELDAREVVLVDEHGRPVGPGVSSPSGRFSGDGGTGLLLTDVGGVWQVGASGLQRLTTGAVTAVGPHHLRLSGCDVRHRCSDLVVDRATGHGRRIPTTTDPADDGVLSPDGRFVVTLRVDGQRPYADVGPLDRRRAHRSFLVDAGDATTIGTTAGWLSERWLAVLENGELTLYDAVADRVVRPELPMSGLIQLAFRPS